MERSEQQRRVQSVSLAVLATVAVGFVLFWFREVMIPFVLALFFSFALGPLVDVQVRRLRMPRVLAVLASLMLGVVVLAVIGGVLSSSVRELSASASVYQAHIEQMFERASQSPILTRFEIDTSRIDFSSLVPTERLGALVMSTTNAILNLLSKGTIVLIFLFFLLMGESARPLASQGVRADVEGRIRRYIVLQAGISMATGVAVWAILAILGVPLAAVFGLAAFLLNFIPSIGSIIATLLPLPVVMVTPDISFATAVLAIAIPGALQFAVGNLIAPKLFGDSLELDPVVILLALMAWGAIWGIVGMLLATPITAVMKMLFERLEMTRPLARLMSGKPS